MLPFEIDDKVKKLIKGPRFFEPAKFEPFEKDITNPQLKIKPDAITEINVKCYGYGYFEEGNANIQTQIKQNLISYLRDAVRECKNIRTFKLDFNGFSVDDKCLIKIIQICEDLVKDKNQKESLWIHTRFLKDCDKNTVEDMLGLTDILVKSSYEEVSVMMSAWQFKKDPISYGQLQTIFGNFGKNLAPMPRSPLKRVKIDISSWYMINLEAYQLLSKTLAYSEIAKKMQIARSEERQNGKQKHQEFSQAQLTQSKDMLLRYLATIDEKYSIQNPIPGKGPKYIKADKEYEKRKIQYIRDLLRKGISRQDLRRVYEEAWRISEDHQTNLTRIRQAVDQEEADQEKRLEHQEEVIDLANDLEKEITKEYMKNPHEFVLAERVKAFHKLIITFVADIQANLESLQEFELDMRNWNGLFQMHSLKMLLDKEFAQMGALKLIGNAFSQILANLNANKEDENEHESKLKLTFNM